MRTDEQKQREKALLKTAKSSYKRLKRNQNLFHEMRNKILKDIVSSDPSFNLSLKVTKHGV